MAVTTKKGHLLPPILQDLPTEPVWSLPSQGYSMAGTAAPVQNWASSHRNPMSVPSLQDVPSSCRTTCSVCIETFDLFWSCWQDFSSWITYSLPSTIPNTLIYIGSGEKQIAFVSVPVCQEKSLICKKACLVYTFTIILLKEDNISVIYSDYLRKWQGSL